MSAQSDPAADRRSQYQGRVTLDFDGYADQMRYHAIRAYHALDQQAAEVEIAISSSGGGLHMVGWFERSLSFGDRIKLRRSLGGDQKRIEIDIERAMHGICTGVLWSEKDKSGEKQRGFRDVYDALDALNGGERLDADRVQNYQNGGHKAAPRLSRLVDE